MDDDMVEHMVENQLAPQLLARDLREAGVDVTAEFVYTGPDERPGWTKVECISCGRSAQIHPNVAPPEGKAALCPRCARGDDD